MRRAWVRRRIMTVRNNRPLWSIGLLTGLTALLIGILSGSAQKISGPGGPSPLSWPEITQTAPPWAYW